MQILLIKASMVSFLNGYFLKNSIINPIKKHLLNN